MIIDTSAVLAVLLAEPDAEHYEKTIAHTLPRQMSAVGLLEAAIVLESRGGMAAQAARRAWRRFGKGNHPAGLNFGDCFAYALAETNNEPLLFKGEDFARTDIEAADELDLFLQAAEIELVAVTAEQAQATPGEPGGVSARETIRPD